MKYIPLFLLLTSCTFNIAQTDTHGYADDVNDTNQTADGKLDATIPITP